MKGIGTIINIQINLFLCKLDSESDLGWGQGILYLKNEDKASKLLFMKDLEHIEGNWYYFEAQE